MPRRKIFMEYIVVAFRSRTHTVKFSEYLRNYGINNEIVNTPKEAGVGCGLSVKIAPKSFGTVKNAIRYANLNSYAGCFYVRVTQSGKTVRNAF
jgi:hypothetical protein